MPNTAICPECGAAVELPSDRAAGFCISCGAMVPAGAYKPSDNVATVLPPEDILAEEPAPPLYDNGGYPNAEPRPYDEVPTDAPPPKKRPAKLFAAVCAALVVVAAVCFTVPALAGSPYRRAETNFLASLVSGPSPLLDVQALSGAGRRVDFTAEYAPGADLLFGDSGRLFLSGSLSAAGENARADVSLSSDGGRAADFIFATDGRELILSAPELTSYYLNLVSDAAVFAPDPGELDEKALGDTFANIFKAYFELTDGAVKTEKDAKLTFGDVEVECDKYIVTFTEKMAAELLLTAIDEIRANTSLMDYLNAILESQSDMYGYDGYSFDELLDEAEAELSTENFNNAVLFRMTVWAKGKDVLARRFGDFQGSDASVYYQSLKTNDRRSIAAELIADGDDVKLSAEFVKSGAAWNGGAELSVTDTYYGGETLRITANCANITYREKLVSGNIDVTGELYEGDDGAVSFSAVLDGGGGRQTVTVSGSAYDGYDDWDLGKLTLSCASSDIDGVTPPALDADRSVTVNDYSEENQRRASEMSEELYRLAEDYEDNGDDFAAGLLWALAELAEGVGYGYGDDWYDYDDDWYDYGDDWYDYDDAWYEDDDWYDYDYGYDYDFELDDDYGFGGYEDPVPAQPAFYLAASKYAVSPSE